MRASTRPKDGATRCSGQRACSSATIWACVLVMMSEAYPEPLAPSGFTVPVLWTSIHIRIRKMNTPRWLPSTWPAWVGVAARLILGGVYIAAGLLKVTALEYSVVAVNAYQLLPYDLARVVGYLLPFAEIGLGLFLIAGLFTRLSGLASAVVMAVFIVGIASAWARGLSIDCGCFGGGGTIEPQETAYPQEILRDLGLLALSVWLVVFPRTGLSLDAVRAPIEEHQDTLQSP